MGITEQWKAVAEMVGTCAKDGNFSAEDHCTKVSVLLHAAECAIILHRADKGLPLWYNTTVRDVLGVSHTGFGPANLARILGLAPPRALAAFLTFLHWQQAGHEGLCRFQMALRDAQGTERFWYICCGKLPAEGPAVILSVCFDVERLVGQLHPSAMPAPAVSPEKLRAYLSLTVREREILRCIAMGSKNSDIANTLCISEETVQTHRRNILRKLNIHSALGLAPFVPLMEAEG
jgi:DNA-binding CsgD family transcriptional regulator